MVEKEKTNAGRRFGYTVLIKDIHRYIYIVTWCPTEKKEIRLPLFPVDELTVASRQSKECGSERRPTDVGTL